MIEIIKKPFVKEHMERFVKNKGKVAEASQVSKKKSIQPEAAVYLNELKKQDFGTLNAKERLKLEKEYKRQEEFELMKQAAASNAYNNRQAANKNRQNIFSTKLNGGTGMIPEEIPEMNSSMEQTKSSMGTVKHFPMDQSLKGTSKKMFPANQNPYQQMQNPYDMY